MESGVTFWLAEALVRKRAQRDVAVPLSVRYCHLTFTLRRVSSARPSTTPWEPVASLRKSESLVTSVASCSIASAAAKLYVIELVLNLNVGSLECPLGRNVQNLDR